MSGERAQGTHDVELVEVDETGTVDVAGTADDGSSAATGLARGELSGPPPVRAAWWRRRLWWLAAGLVVVVVAVPSLVHVVQVRMRVARLAGVPGIVAPIDGPVHERWSVDASFPSLGELGGVLVGTVTDENGVMSARGIDATTGVAAWSAPVTVPSAWGGSCALAGGPVSGRQKAVLACHVVDEASTVPPEAGVRSLGQPLKAHLETRDPRTGAVLGTFPAGPLDTISAIGTDIAIASHQAAPTGGASTVRRWDPRTGTLVWTARHADPASGASSSTQIQGSGGVLVVENGGDVWEVSASGAELRAWTGLRTDTSHWLTRTVGGHVLWASYGASFGGAATQSGDATGATSVTPDTIVVDDLGEGTTFTLDHPVPWTATVDDGSAPDLLLVAGPDPVAYDLRSGTAIWRPTHEVDAFVVLDGTVYAAGAGTVSALDARTGATRWTVRTGSSERSGTLATDGRSLIVARVPVGSSGSIVEALDLTDGSVSWTSALSHTFDALVLLGGRLAAFSAEDPGRITVLG